MNGEIAYLELLKEVLDASYKDDRTGTGTTAVFGRMYRHDLSLGFPLLTTKKVHLKSIIHELLWFLKGDTNIKYLNDNGVTIWDEWADENGDLGPVYGAQWRKWKTPDGQEIDQIANTINLIKTNPSSRRILFHAWNVSDLPVEGATHLENVKNGKMVLPPCHLLYQFFVQDGKLSCMMTQRSADLFMGVPFNLASVALLTHMIAQQCDLEVGEVIHSIGDAHIYSNLRSQCETQVKREIRPLPKLVIKRKPESIFDYKYEDFEVVGYDPHPAITGKVAV
jgi:thymidylate synthase